MKNQIVILVSLLLVSSASRVSAEELILAGGDETFIVDAAEAEAGRVRKLWSWLPQQAPDLPDDARREFHHLDECKPVDDGRRFLICASNGGCVLLERATKRIVWRARARNAHSLELLPRDRVVVASSLSGDHLEVFDVNGPSTPVFKTPLRSAHGLCWDSQRQCLWALGYDELRRYTLVDWDGAQPKLELAAAHRLPDADGHDLRPAPNTADLLLTTEQGVYRFDRDQATFRPHVPLATAAKVKSVDVHPTTGRMVLSTWGPTVRLLDPPATITFPDARPYKARWVR